MNELNQLRNQIDRYDSIYYNGGGRPVDDSTYDTWKRLLKELAPTDERLARVGAPVSSANTGKKAKHVNPMGSLDNVMNEDEFLAWHGKMPPDTCYNVSFKMDGCSIALIYQDGYLLQAITRGDGVLGEEVTANALRMQGVPKCVEMSPSRAFTFDGGQGVSIPVPSDAPKRPFTGSVRGEVMLYNEDWKKLDPDQLSNPRNLGNGMARRHDGKDCELLRFVAFRGFDGDGNSLGKTESDNLRSLADLGFDVVDNEVEYLEDDVLKHYSDIQKERDSLLFEIDGLVIKVEDLNLQKAMGTVNNRPKGQIALKFPPRGADTALLDVEWTVGHTGAVVPTAVLSPVKVGGVTVTRASLYNMDEINKLELEIGDIVSVVRCGDVIPRVISVSERKLAGEAPKPPSVCPVCDGEVGKKQGVKGADGVHLYCLNPDCSAKQLGKIKTWVSKLDIQGLGDVYLEALCKEMEATDPMTGPYKYRALSSVADIYRLHELRGTAALVAVVGVARTPKVLAEIDKKRDLSLSDFLGSLGIEGLGRRRVKLVQEAAPGEFDTLKDWESGKLLKMAAAVGLPNIAANIQRQIDENNNLIHALLDAGVTIQMEKTEKKSEPAAGQLTFCITGKLSQPKNVYHDLMTAKGHRFEESYRKGLSYLVAAYPASGSSKLVKAAKDGVPVISEEELMEKLK